MVSYIPFIVGFKPKRYIKFNILI